MGPAAPGSLFGQSGCSNPVRLWGRGCPAARSAGPGAALQPGNGAVERAGVAGAVVPFALSLGRVWVWPKPDGARGSGRELCGDLLSGPSVPGLSQGVLLPLSGLQIFVDTGLPALTVTNT